MKIALFDDDPDQRRLIEEFLIDINQNVISIAKESPQEIQSINECDALIIDVRTRADRYAGVNYILAQRAANNVNKETLVIFISTFGRENPELLSLLSKCGDYKWMDKPFDFAELKRCLIDHEKSLKKG